MTTIEEVTVEDKKCCMADSWGEKNGKIIPQVTTSATFPCHRQLMDVRPTSLIGFPTVGEMKAFSEIVCSYHTRNLFLSPPVRDEFYTYTQHICTKVIVTYRPAVTV